MQQIPDRDIEKAVTLFSHTYNTDTVEQMVQIQRRYREYIKKLVGQFETSEQMINDIVWERYQVIREKEIREEKANKQRKIRKNEHAYA